MLHPRLPSRRPAGRASSPKREVDPVWWRVVSAFLLCLIACSGGRIIGGSAGSPAVTCDSSTPICTKVRDILEFVRSSIGSGSGAPAIRAHMELIQIGSAAGPFLGAALGDRQLPIALFAAAVLVDIGESDRVLKWCAAFGQHPNAAMCPQVQKLLASRRSSTSVVGSWKGEVSHATKGSGSHVVIVKRPLSLSINQIERGVAGHVCYGSRWHCYPLMEGVQSGARLQLRYRDNTLVLWVSPDGRIMVGTLRTSGQDESWSVSLKRTR